VLFRSVKEKFVKSTNSWILQGSLQISKSKERNNQSGSLTRKKSDLANRSQEHGKYQPSEQMEQMENQMDAYENNRSQVNSHYQNTNKVNSNSKENFQSAYSNQMGYQHNQRRENQKKPNKSSQQMHMKEYDNELKELDPYYKNPNYEQPKSSINKKDSSQKNKPIGLGDNDAAAAVSLGSAAHSIRKHENKENSSQKSQKINGLKQNERIFIALFDYDPLTMSPNVETCNEELPFLEGQLIKILGDQDADGFYYGDSLGRNGFIPCNMITEVQVDDPFIVQQLLNDINRHPYNEPTTNTTSNSNKSFQPINSYQQNTQVNSFDSDREKNINKMVAMFDYDPMSLSPNADLETELSFKHGDVITIYGHMDEDGFYLGELNGKRGLVPSNYLQPYNCKPSSKKTKNGGESYRK